MTDDYSFDFSAPGADGSAVVAASDENCAVVFAGDDWLLDALAALPQTHSASDPASVDVPMWGLLVAFQEALHLGDPDLGGPDLGGLLRRGHLAARTNTGLRKGRLSRT